MLYQIVIHTPLWVWGLFALLLWLGIRQAMPGRMGMRRVIAMPVAMTILSLYGTVSALGASPTVLLAWLASAGACAALVLQRPLADGTGFDATTRTLQLPGSWAPLALMMGIFATKYCVGVTLHMQPALTTTPGFGPGFAALYGALSGALAARALRLLRLAFGNTTSLAHSGWGAQ